MNKRWISVIVLFLVLSATATTIGCGHEPVPTPYVAEEFAICTNAGEQFFPAISGDIVVWMDNRVGIDGHLYYKNRATSTGGRLSNTDSNQTYQAIG